MVRGQESQGDLCSGRSKKVRLYQVISWRVRLVAYGARLESGLGRKPLEGSNPSLSAILHKFQGARRSLWYILIWIISMTLTRNCA